MGTSHGRVLLAAEKGKLLGRLKRMTDVQKLNRQEIDMELLDEIQAVKTQYSQIDHVANLWDRGEISQYNRALEEYTKQYGPLK